MKALLIYLLIPLCTATQWPGYFYSFTLTDATGKLITVKDKAYKMTIVKPAKGGDVMLDIGMCGDSTTLRFYAGGYHGLDDTHKMEIIKLMYACRSVLVQLIFYLYTLFCIILTIKNISE